MATKSHYDLLGVRQDADIDVIRASYRMQIRKHHPDLAGEAGASLTGQLNAAYDTLKDPHSRQEYDLTLAGPVNSSSPRPPSAEWAAPAETPNYMPTATPAPAPAPKPWAPARYKTWLTVFGFSFLLLAASVGYAWWAALLNPAGELPLRALSVPIIIFLLLAAVLRWATIWLRIGTVLVTVFTALAAVGFPQFAFFPHAVGTLAAFAIAAISPAIALTRWSGKIAWAHRSQKPRRR